MTTQTQNDQNFVEHKDTETEINTNQDQNPIEVLTDAEPTNQEQENEQVDDSELARLRAKNKQLLDESKTNKTKAKDIQQQLDSQLSELEKLKNIEAEFLHFKKSVLWDEFLDRLHIVPEFRNYISSELVAGGFNIKKDRKGQLIVVDKSDNIIDLSKSTQSQLSDFVKAKGSMFLNMSLATGGGYGSTQEPRTPNILRAKAQQLIEFSEKYIADADKIEAELLQRKQDPKGMTDKPNFGLR